MTFTSKWNFLFENLPSGVVFQDRSGAIQEVNAAAERVLGLTADQMKGKTSVDPDWRAVKENGDPFPGEEHPAMVALRTGKTVENVMMGVYHPPKRDWVWININSIPIFEQNDPVPSSVVSIFEDVTQSKKAEEDLQKTNENYRNLFYNSPQAYLIIQNGVFVECNRSSEQIMAADRAYIIGRSPDEISPEFQPNGRRSTDLVIEHLDKVFREGQNIFEWTHVKMNGELFLAEISLTISEYNKAPSILVRWRDITEEKQTIRMVKRLSQIVDQSPVSIFMTDRDGNIEYVNKATTTNIGYTQEELLGVKPGVWKSGLTEKSVYDRLWETVRGGKKFTTEFVNKRKDGTLIHESSTIFPILDEDNTISNFVAFQENITARKIAEAEVKLFKDVFDSDVNGALITDLDNCILHANRRYGDLLMIDRDKLIGSSFDTPISADSKPNFNFLQKRLFKYGHVSSIEIQYENADGFTFPALVSASFVKDEKDEDRFISYTIVDISERKKIEHEIIDLNFQLEEKVKNRTKELETAINRLETFFEVSMDMLCISHQTGRFIKLSKAFESILHFDRKELEGSEFMLLVHPDDVERTKEAMMILQSQQPVSRFVNRYRTKEGEYRYIEWFASPLGEYVYSVARDITEQKAREEELITARRIAEEANASKSLFLSRMSHELRTPMNSILGFAQLMEMGELNEMQESAVRHILQSGQHLLGLINEVLDIARIETGKISLSIEQVNVTLTIKEVCALLDPLAQKNAVTISVGNSLQKDMFIHADQQRTVQILTNLINNAIKYNKENGKVMIEQSVRLNESGKEVVRISIKDTGVGIKQDDLSRLFTPFERIGAQNTNIEGTGLGLAVVKELIHVLGGELGVSSEIDQGSEFWIELPRCTDDLLPTFEADQEDIALQKANTNQATVLYIEDNSMNIALVTDIFKVKRPWFGLITTEFGAEAVGLALKHRPQLILLDLDLPDIHGSIVLKQLKENEETKTIPVVVVSADATKDQIRNLLSGGADKYLTKPLEIKEFLETVDHYIEQK